ncbi:hypothetical protein EDB85DRAFT_1952079 [Lactarius pseudohatsudake]|nr:hypothetical protein EDB85DRAFT_1952079 [Lactarius pseudohatsudake]
MSYSPHRLPLYLIHAFTIVSTYPFIYSVKIGNCIYPLGLHLSGMQLSEVSGPCSENPVNSTSPASSAASLAVGSLPHGRVDIAKMVCEGEKITCLEVQRRLVSRDEAMSTTTPTEQRRPCRRPRRQPQRQRGDVDNDDDEGDPHDSSPEDSNLSDDSPDDDDSSDNSPDDDCDNDGGGNGNAGQRTHLRSTRLSVVPGDSSRQSAHDQAVIKSDN